MKPHFGVTVLCITSIFLLDNFCYLQYLSHDCAMYGEPVQ